MRNHSRVCVQKKKVRSSPSSQRSSSLWLCLSRQEPSQFGCWVIGLLLSRLIGKFGVGVVGVGRAVVENGDAADFDYGEAFAAVDVAALLQSFVDRLDKLKQVVVVGLHWQNRSNLRMSIWVRSRSPTRLMNIR